MTEAFDIKAARLFVLVEEVSKADTIYPRGSEAQIRLIEQLAQDARYVMSLFKPSAKVEGQPVGTLAIALVGAEMQAEAKENRQSAGGME